MTKHRWKIQHALRVFCTGALQTNREMARDMKKHGFPPKGWGIDWKTCKKFKLSEHWAEEWAKFSGRPRGRHEQTIWETVHEAQELLCALALGAERKTLADDRDMCHFDYMKDKWVGYVSHPKSLGELCLEVASNSALSKYVGNEYTFTNIRVNPVTFTFKGPLEIILPKDSIKLRELMWHTPKE